MNKLKRAVIKEELVALTGNPNRAIVLNQMIYWSERTKDTDKYLRDEIARSKMAMGQQEREQAEKLEELDLFSHGWIYKSAVELSEETMIGVSKSTMGTYLKHLVDNGWLDKRKNPQWKGDNTFQYRVNLVKIQSDLEALGYALEGYPLLSKSENTTSMSNNRTSEFGNKTDGSEIEQPVRKSNNQFENRTTLPEITSNITSNITSKNFSSSLSSEEQDMLEVLLGNEGFNEREIKETIQFITKKGIKSFRANDVIKQLEVMKDKTIDYRPIYFANGLATNVGRVEKEAAPTPQPMAHGNVPMFNWLEQ